MTSLTRISIIARKIIRYGIFGIILFIVARSTILTGIRIYRHFYPEPPPPPTVKFNKLPKLPFPEKQIPEGLTYTLETPNGELPVFNTQAKVYFMPKLSPYFGSLDEAKVKARKLGFSDNVKSESETIYVFSNPKVPSELKINIVTGVFSISYNLSSDPSPIEKKPPVAEIADSLVKSFLSSGGLLPEDLSGPLKSEFLKVENQQLVGTISLSDANLIKVKFFRKSFEDIPSLTANPDQANVWFIVSGSNQKEKQIVAGEFHHFPVEESNNSTYPIKTSQQAWQELQENKAYIANVGTNENNNKITIRRVYLAYFDPPAYTDFYQPIVVFEGDGGFVAYIPAVTSEYYGE
ncbi:MAG TPA: hypothetical protein VJ399_03060 [Patescibacteria group bacterium]|nr:hypothetical protein [Patescibacteria group bacterium]